ncbi:hypothetical protein EOD39_9275 [Acipenser ruthenus]|uniref:Uncharacterized protein n=1 Tax=Acipenser ruthenus TaxID=7906 RepID=A0A662YV87_ACIRT|nr:hypothetical protein EOD39_9275 [Acipenser ruthenus]
MLLKMAEAENVVAALSIDEPTGTHPAGANDSAARDRGAGADQGRGTMAIQVGYWIVHHPVWVAVILDAWIRGLHSTSSQLDLRTGLLHFQGGTGS